MSNLGPNYKFNWWENAMCLLQLVDWVVQFMFIFLVMAHTLHTLRMPHFFFFLPFQFCTGQTRDINTMLWPFSVGSIYSHSMHLWRNVRPVTIKNSGNMFLIFIVGTTGMRKMHSFENQRRDLMGIFSVFTLVPY